MYDLLKGKLYLSHLIQFDIITRTTGNGNRQLTAGMRKVPMTPFTAPANKPACFSC